MLSNIMLVIGTKIRLFSFWILMSPGRFPNHLNAFGKKYKTTPINTIPIPINIIHLAIV